MDRPTPLSPATASSPRHPGPSWLVWVTLAAVLLLHATLAIRAASEKSVTADELLHVTQGYFANRHNDFRVQPENGILPQRLHGLAPLITHAPAPPLENNEAWGSSSATMIGHQFFYETGHDHFPMLMLARSLNVLFSLGTAWLVFWWARRLGGVTAGLTACALYALDPNVLAHAALATSDLAAVFFLLGSLTLFWRMLEKPDPRTVLASAVVFGLACVAKYSAVLLPPMMLALVIVRVAGDRERRRWWKILPPVALAHAVAAVFIIWAFYGFRYGGFSPDLPPSDRYIARWEEILPHIGLHAWAVEIGRQHHLLPEPFLYGYAFVVYASQARSAFLAGEYSIFGWPSFFPLAFLWKTPPVVLLGLTLAVAALALRWKKAAGRIGNDLRAVAPLAVLFGLYWAVSLTSKLNIGHRHILPTYPVLYILLGAWAASLAPHLLRRAALALLLLGQAATCALSAPHFLAYFNPLAGGPAQGYRLLVDSSLDWGQDLAGLDRWLKTHNTGPSAAPVFISYFGSGEPNYYGIRATRLPFINGFKFVHPPYEPRAGLYCISATMLQQVYSSYRGPWTAGLERTYQDLRALGRQIAAQPGRAWDPALWRKYDEVRFARLCFYLRAREPDDAVGHSILIYRLTADDLRDALEGDAATLATAVLHAGQPRP